MGEESNENSEQISPKDWVTHKVLINEIKRSEKRVIKFLTLACLATTVAILAIMLVILAILVFVGVLNTSTSIHVNVDGKIPVQIVQPDQELNLDANAILDVLESTSETTKFRKTKTAYADPKCSNIPEERRLNCYPEVLNATEKQCLSRGCCWTRLVRNKSDNQTVNPPNCFFPTNYQGYVVKNLKRSHNGIHATLKRNQPSGFPSDIDEAQLTVTYISDSVLRIKITDRNSDRYEVPYPWLPEFRPKLADTLKKKYDLQLNTSGRLTIQRKENGLTLFDTDLSKLVFADQFLQVSTFLPSKYIYGLGEYMDGLPRNVSWRKMTLFNRDPQEAKPGINLYGAHPFYLLMEEDGNSHGVFLFNSNPMDVILQPAPAVTFRPIGGIFDIFVFLGPKPANVVSQYISLIGMPFMPPYWSLGFHLCRFGYYTTEGTRKVWERTRKAGIPFDVQWNDIDYMERHNDFTYDKVAFKNFSGFIKEVHDAGMHYVLMFDPGIGASEPRGTYAPYDDGVAMDIFIKNSTGQILLGKVWNEGFTAFPDFLHPRIFDYWTKQFRDFHEEIPYDGAWIDMNEPSNLIDGSSNGCPKNSSLEYPPYVTGDAPIYQKTVCMSAQHFDEVHYDVHNIYGFTEAIATNIALQSVLQKRPFIISRATFPGQGHYSGHWNGDVWSDWESLRWSIPSILNFNMFGIPMVGSDICGFHGNTTVELCARWFTLGAFYPFSRNHNEHITSEQDPVALGPVVIAAAKNALLTRYLLLPYLYSLFYKSTAYGETVARPLFFEFPNDKTTYLIQTQFLWGSALMIIPTLHKGARDVKAYFPAGLWYDFYTKKARQSKGEYITLPSPLESINLAVRGGYILPGQEPGVTTTESRKNDFHFIVALDNNRKASGFLYWDDGETIDSFEQGQFNYFVLESHNNTFTSECMECNYKTNMTLGKVEVLGVNAKPTNVTANGRPAKFEYNDQSKYLEISGLKLDLRRTISIKWK